MPHEFCASLRDLTLSRFKDWAGKRLSSSVPSFLKMWERWFYHEFCNCEWHFLQSHFWICYLCICQQGQKEIGYSQNDWTKTLLPLQKTGLGNINWISLICVGNYWFDSLPTTLTQLQVLATIPGATSFPLFHGIIKAPNLILHAYQKPCQTINSHRNGFR